MVAKVVLWGFTKATVTHPKGQTQSCRGTTTENLSIEVTLEKGSEGDRAFVLNTTHGVIFLCIVYDTFPNRT